MVKVHKKKAKIKHSSIKQLTRKEIRKQRKVEKKQNKRLFFSNTRTPRITDEILLTDRKQEQQQRSNKKQAKMKVSETNSDRVDSDNNESLDSNFSDEEVNSYLPDAMKQSKCQKNLTKKPKSSTTSRSDIEEQHRRELKRKKDLESQSRKRRIKQLKLENEEENKLIAKLEKKLKLNKTKSKNRLVRKMFSDGLDFALELCLDDEGEDGKSKKSPAAQNTVKSEVPRLPNWSDEEEDNERFNAVFGKGDDVNSADGNNSVGNESEEDVHGSVVDSSEDEKKSEEKYKEDIYGRTRDKDGNIVKNLPEESQKYVPPHQRVLISAKTDNKQLELLENIHRQCKGLLNRLSEANIHKISVGIEELYMKNSRFNMNETLNKLLQDALICRVLCNERMIQEHMVLLAYLHAHIGSEIGAYFLQTFIEKFDQLLNELNNLIMEDKRLNNIVLILSYMYLFKIFEYQLLLEIVARLSSQLSEKTIECLLLIFQSIGFKLRKDNPSAFKEMLLDVRTKISTAPLELKENLRLKFMIDILHAIKNNNMSKIPKFDPEVHENLRKKLKAMLRNDKYVTTLNITLDDLLKANSVGKWWIVGSAWSGDISEMASAQKSNVDDKTNASAKKRFSEKILTLAKHQKMNTEERRNIFCIIMSADDYVDAFEKILHLSLKDQRSIAYVIIHCCLNEKSSNPYYAYLALKFCLYNHKYQLAFQFASWDRINDIDALNKAQLRNLAKFLKHLILHGGLQLSTLKVIDFLHSNRRNFILMEEICKNLLLSDDEQKLYQSFERLAKNTKLRQFKQNMRLFLQHFLLEAKSSTQKLSDEQLELMKQRIEYIDKLLVYIDL